MKKIKKQARKKHVFGFMDQGLDSLVVKKIWWTDESDRSKMLNQSDL